MHRFEIFPGEPKKDMVSWMVIIFTLLTIAVTGHLKATMGEQFSYWYVVTFYTNIIKDVVNLLLSPII